MAAAEVSREDRSACIAVMEDMGDRVKTVMWVSKENSKGTLQDRLVAVGGYVVISLKKALTGYQTQRIGHLYDLRTLMAPGTRKLDFVFKDFHLLFTTADEASFNLILNAVLQSWAAITVNFPESSNITVGMWNFGKAPAVPKASDTTWDNFVETLKAHSIHMGLPIEENLVKTIDVGKAFDRELNLNGHRELNVSSKKSTISLRPLVAALKHNHWFTRVDLSDTYRPDAVLAFATALAKNSTIDDVCLRNVGASQGFSEFHLAIKANPTTNLTSLDLSGNLMRDVGLQALAPGLGLVPLVYLNLSRCGFRAVGLGALATAFSASDKISKSLVELDIGHNTFGPTGTERLASWMSTCSPVLVTLSVPNTGVDVATLGAALLSCHKLEHIDFGSAKMEARDSKALASALAEITALHSLDLSRCDSPPNSLAKALEALASNPKRAAYGASFVCNDISFDGVTSTAVIAKALKSCSVLTNLSLDRTQLTARGLGLIFEAVGESCRMLTTISLQANVLTSERIDNPGHITDAMTKLVAMIDKIPLESLNLRGAPGYSIGPDLAPFLQFLPKASSLTFLDVAYNAIGPVAVSLLAASLSSPDCTLANIHFDGNNSNLDSMQAISNALSAATNLTDFEWPEVDLNAITNSLGKLYKKKELVTKKAQLVDVRNHMRSVMTSNLARRPQERTLVHKVFGVDLDATMSKYSDVQDVPIMMRRCIDYIYAKGLETDGIFRISGNADHVQALCDAFDADESFAFELDADLSDVYCVAACLKQYLRQLPEPLIPFGDYNAFIACASLTDPTKFQERLMDLINLLPTHNYSCLREMCKLLNAVAARQDKNRMGVGNLTLVIQPNVLRPQVESLGNIMDMSAASQIMKKLIEAYTIYFGEEDEEDGGPGPASGSSAAGGAGVGGGGGGGGVAAAASPRAGSPLATSTSGTGPAVSPSGERRKSGASSMSGGSPLGAEKGPPPVPEKTKSSGNLAGATSVGADKAPPPSVPEKRKSGSGVGDKALPAVPEKRKSGSGNGLASTSGEASSPTGAASGSEMPRRKSLGKES